MGTAGPESSRKALLEDLLSDLGELAAADRLFTRSCPVAAVGAVEVRPKRRRKPRNIAGPLTVILGILLILSAGYWAVQYVRAGIYLQGARDDLRGAGTELGILRDELSEAAARLKQGDYKGAYKSYESARSNATLAREQLLRATARLSPGSVQTEAAKAAAELAAVIRQADEALKDPKVSCGGRGLVEFEGEWMTPAERDRRFEARMKAEGKVRYEGEWLTPAEVARKRGLVFHEGRYISAEEYQKLIARQKEPTAPQTPPLGDPRPTTPLPATTAVSEFGPAAKEWVLDNFEQAHNWGSVPISSWRNANPCRLNVTEGTQTKRLEVELLGGTQDKSAIVRKLNRLDLTSRSRIVMDVDNQCGENVQLAIAFITDTYYESRIQWLRPGLNRGVSFDLTARDFKCNASKWNHSAKIERADSALYLHFLVYHNQPGKVVFDNITARGGK